jgi:hypothetical protein
MAATQLYAPSGSMEPFVVQLLDQVGEDPMENSKFKRKWFHTRHKPRLFWSDDEDALAPAPNEAAPVEEFGCESGSNRD